LTTETEPASAAGPRTALALAALGIVFGDIGTSPLYALRECFLPGHGVEPTHENVLGVLSLVVWSLTLVVSVKYLGFIMRADNHGEGGIFALLALIAQDERPGSIRGRTTITLLALFGAALLYGDGIITPAISVLSAVEGLNVATTAAEHWVVPLTVAILVGLFAVQRRGTARIGRVFGPVMLLWFLVIAVAGVAELRHTPSVLWALNPVHAVRFFLANGLLGFETLGAVVLVITGGEALYADMGHFGRPPIRRSWFVVVFPALLLNYFGQGALLLRSAAARSNPFYGLIPQPLLLPAVALATIAAIIASQALISGAFSLTRQAVQLGYIPRLSILHTSDEQEGQIFLPAVNQFLALSCVGLVLAFGASSKMAAAYGIAVTGTMTITTIAFFVITWRSWRWPFWQAAGLAALFLAFDVPYFLANLVKFAQGGWFPLVVAMALYAAMTTWKRGRTELADRFAAEALPIEAFLKDLDRHDIPRVRGTGVFLSANTSATSRVLLHHLKHNQMLHQQVVLLSVLTPNTPLVPASERVTVEPLGHGFHRVVAKYGYRQSPRVPEIMRRCRDLGLVAPPNTTTYYVGRETLLSRGPSTMMRWRKKLFSLISRNARPSTDFFSIPPGRVVELGMQIDL
jgi:KUP system potassium uptake protein